MLLKAFSAADLNNDGYLTESELQMFLDKQSQRNGHPEFNYEIFQILMKKLDKNKDGKITLDEFIEYYVDGELRIKSKIKETVKMMAERVDRRTQTEQRLS